MSVLVHFECVIKDGYVEKLTALLKGGLPDTRAYEGCHGLTVYLAEDGKTLVAIEHWDSKEHYQRYFAWRTETGVMDAIGAHLEAPPKIRFFEALDV